MNRVPGCETQIPRCGRGHRIRNQVVDRRCAVDVERLRMFEERADEGATPRPVPNGIREAVNRLDEAGRTTGIVRRRPATQPERMVLPVRTAGQTGNGSA